VSRSRNLFVPLRALMVIAIALLGLVALRAPAVAEPVPLTLTITPSSTNVPSGSSLTYSLHMENTGGAQLDDVVLNAQMNGLTGIILTSTVGSCDESDSLVHCDAGSLEGFSSWDVTIRGTVTAANGTTLHNGATASGTHSSNTDTASAYADVLVTNAVTEPLPDLKVSVQGPTSIGEGQEATFKLTVNNIGTANAVDVRVSNTLPANFSFVSAVGNSLFVCSSTPPLTVTCTGGRVNMGANATITIVATAGFGYNAATDPPLKDTAVVDPYDEIDELNELNNTGSLLSQPVQPPAQQGLTIAMTDAPNPVRPGQLLTYLIHIENIAATRADSVAMVDTTQGLQASSITATTTKGVCTVSAPKVTCTQKNPTLRLDPGQSMDVTITGRVVNTAGSLITNTATVTGNIKNKGVTNTAKTTTTVNPGVDLSVVQHAVVNHNDNAPAVPDAFRAWDNFDYEISIGNSGLDDATDVVVRELLAPGVVLKSYTSSTGAVACGQSGQVVTCTGLDVAGSISSGSPGGTVEKITLTVIAPPTTGSIDATFTVDPNNAIFESDETNNSWTASALIETGIDLTVTKASEPKVAPSGTLIYTITASNIGTQDATGVVVRDTLPAGTRFREVVGDHNFTCHHNGAATGGIIECVGGNLRGTHDHTLAPDQATITVTLFAPAAPGFIKNQVRIDPDGQIDEILEDNNINTLITEIIIDGGCCVYHEFTIDKTQVSPAGDVAPHGIVEYDLVVKNHGSDVAFDVVVEDHMPDGMVFRSAEDTLPGTGAFTCQLAGQVIRCTGGTLDGSIGQTALAGDQTRTIHVNAFAPDQPGSYINQAIIDPDNADPESNETNNQDSVTTVVALGGGGSYIDLKADSSQSAPVDGGGNPTDVVPSGNLHYKLKLENVGTAVAFNVTARDTIPDGAVFRSAVDTSPGAGAFACSEVGGVITCTGGTLDGSNNDTPAAGDNVRFIDVALFAPTQPGDYINQVTIDPDEVIAENDETNNSDQTLTRVRLSGGGNYTDLKVSSIASSNATPEPEQSYDYTVTIENTGTDPAYNVSLRNVLDPEVTFVKVTTTAAGSNDLSCSQSNGVITCDGGVLDGSNDLDPTFDNTAEIVITVKAPREQDYTYPLQSRVDPANTTPESNEANNTAFKDVNVKAVMDLQTTISATGSQGSNGSVTFTAQRNGGFMTNAFVTVVANLPVGTIPLDVDAPDGWNCQIEENPINKVTCTGAMTAGENASFTVTTYVTGGSGQDNASSTIDPDNVYVEVDETNNYVATS